MTPPRNPRRSDRHHSACIALSCFLLALPLPSTPTCFLLSFIRFITHHIPLLRGRYLPRHPTSRAYNQAKHPNFIPLRYSYRLLLHFLLLFCPRAGLLVHIADFHYTLGSFYRSFLILQRRLSPVTREFLALITIMAMAMNVTVPIEEPEWNSKPAWKLPGWAEPIVRRVS